MDTNQATAAASPVPFEVDGKERLLHPLTLSDRGYHERWMRSELIASARMANETQTAPDGINPAGRSERAFVLSEAFAAAGRLHMESPNALGFHISVEGQWRIIWASLRKGEPAITLDAVKTEFQDGDVLDHAVGEVMQISRPFFGGLIPAGTAAPTGGSGQADAGPVDAKPSEGGDPPGSEGEENA